MALQRRMTRFGTLGSRRATPESDDEPSDTRPLLVESDNDSTNKLKKRSWKTLGEEESLETRRFSRNGIVESRYKSPRIPQTYQDETRTIDDVRVKHLSPWKSLQKRLTLMLHDSVIIASQEDGRFVAVREFSGQGVEQKIKMLERIKNRNFLACLECFKSEGAYYAVFEHEIPSKTSEELSEKFPVTLAQYARIEDHPTEQQLATILGQILDGLKYLAMSGLEHGSLTCKNILVGTQGSIKIAGQECCRQLVSNRSSTRDIRGVGYVAMELMHKEAKYEGPMRVRDTTRWPLDSKAVHFLTMTETAYSIDELLNHPLFEYERQKIDLKHGVYIAEISVFRGHKIIPQHEQ